ncbi:MAG: hypothetical protein NTY75_02000 [Candidatus Shapirobacteria bacterium]|nr:hypothetical protein [Candidatus Shapirobacteria bacterium]
MKPILPLLSAFVIFLSALLVLFTPLRPQLSFVTPELKLITTPTPIVTLVPELKSEWLTFNNHYFSFLYPVGLSVVDNSINLSQGNKITFTTVSDSSKTIADYLIKQDKISQTAWEGQPSYQVTNTKKTVINCLNCVQRQEYLLAADLNVISTYFKNGNNIYKVQFQPIPGNSTESDIFMYDQILSTFKFTPDTSTWKTFKSKVAPFEIKYPTDLRLSSCSDKSDCLGLEGLDNNKIKDEPNRFYIFFNPMSNLSVNQSFDDWFSQTITQDYRPQYILGQNKTTINQYTVYIVHRKPFDYDNVDDDYYLSDNHSVMKIMVLGNFDFNTKSLIFQILSTFKFTQPVSTTKTYTNMNNGFEFQYPETFQESTYGIKSSDNQISLSVGLKDDQNAITECTKIFKKEIVILDKIPFEKTTHLGSKAGADNFCADSDTTRYISIFIPQDTKTKFDLVYVYHIQNQTQAIKTLNQIATSFKFTP